MNHLEEVNETYLGHFKFACGISRRLLYLSSLCIIHAFLPNYFTHTASIYINKLYNDFKIKYKDTDYYN